MIEPANYNPARRRVKPRPRGGAAARISSRMGATATTTTQPTTLYQRNEISVPRKQAITAASATSAARKVAVPESALGVEGEQEDAEDGAVEDRAQDVDRLDQGAEAARVLREPDRERAPHHGRELRHEHVVTVARVRPHQAPVDVDHRGRRQRVELGRRRVHRGEEHHDDEQADHALRQVVDDEAQEHVVGVVGVELGVAAVQELDRFRAHVGHAIGGRLDADARGLLGGLVAGAHRLEQPADLVALGGERRAVALFQRAPGRGIGAVLDRLGLHAVEEERRLGELVEGEHHGAEEQDEELHRHLGHAVGEEAEPALRHRAAPTGSAAPATDRCRSTRATGTGRRSTPTRSCSGSGDRS